MPSSYTDVLYPTREAWQAAVASSAVRLQWDPDHDPAGVPQERRAIQLGLRGEFLRRFGTERLVSVEDVSELVARERSRAGPGTRELMTPRERVYPLPSSLAARLGAASATDAECAKP